MAVIIRHEVRTQKRNSSSTNGVSAPHETIEITTTVRSIHGSYVSVIRDFTAALDVAEAPGTARIEANRDTVGHLTGLTARWSTVVDSAMPDGDE